MNPATPLSYEQLKRMMAVFDKAHKKYGELNNHLGPVLEKAFSTKKPRRKKSDKK